MALHSAKIGNYDTLKDWGLYMIVGSPQIDPPEPDEYHVQVPGSDTLLNLTTSLDGKVHYKQRTITIKLKCVAPKKRWEAIRTTISNALHGKWLQCTFDNDPSWYWEGIWHVGFVPDRLYGVFTITGTCNPFKYSIFDGSDNWLWDSFNFETDVIRSYTDIQLEEHQLLTVSIPGAPRSAGLYFKRSETAADITVVSSKQIGKVGTLAKSTEWQYISGFGIPDETGDELVFSASADCKISIKYLGASL